MAYINGHTSYDAIGNPLNDGTWKYEWQAGRQLKRLYTDSGNEIKFTYDANGLRIEKESSLGTTKYTLAGANITHMTRGTVDMHFYYDAQGKPAMVRYNGSDYYYVFNVQGDVVAILEKANNNAVCVEYKYDAWGKQVGCTGTKAATVGKDQPFRYRGYVYDEETGWYYLRSRYYNPGMCRFGNADTELTRNQFTYCCNVPVNMGDPTGCYPEFSTVQMYTQQELSALLGLGYVGKARLIFPNDVTIVVDVSQMPKFYHIDGDFRSGQKTKFQKAIEDLGEPYGYGDGTYNTPVPIILELDYTDKKKGTIRTWAVVHTNPHPEVCVWVIDSSGYHDPTDPMYNKGRDNDFVENAPADFKAFAAAKAKASAAEKEKVAAAKEKAAAKKAQAMYFGGGGNER